VSSFLSAFLEAEGQKTITVAPKKVTVDVGQPVYIKLGVWPANNFPLGTFGSLIAVVSDTPGVVAVDPASKGIRKGEKAG
jgi:hypothetical protein